MSFNVAERTLCAIVDDFGTLQREIYFDCIVVLVNIGSC